jgi:hypothetical protein
VFNAFSPANGFGSTVSGLGFRVLGFRAVGLNRAVLAGKQTHRFLPGPLCMCVRARMHRLQRTQAYEQIKKHLLLRDPRAHAPDVTLGGNEGGGCILLKNSKIPAIESSTRTFTKCTRWRGVNEGKFLFKEMRGIFTYIKNTCN